MAKATMDMAKVEEKADALMEKIGELEGVDLSFARDLVGEYSRLAEMVATLGNTIAEEGPMIEIEKGGKGNRHTERVENPAFSVYYKATARMADMAVKTSKFVRQGGADGEETDPLAAFNSR